MSHSRKSKKQIQVSRPTDSLPTILQDRSDNLSEQHVTTLPTHPYITQVCGDKVSTASQEYQMTIRAKRRLDRHQVSMLLMVLICKVLTEGIDFTAALALDFLFLSLIGSKNPEEIRDEKERQTAMLAELIIAYTKGDWLSFTDREEIPYEVRKQIFDSGWLPNRRTIKSWKPFWRPESFLEVRFVRLDSLYERETNTLRYSSYTKGYGNGGHISRIQKTRIDPEIDGEVGDRPEPKISVLEYETYNNILLAIESAKLQKVLK